MTKIYLPPHLMKYKFKLNDELTITYEILDEDEVEILEGEYIYIEDAEVCDQFNIMKVIYGIYDFDRSNPNYGEDE